jgi:Fe-S-cluster containining protein
LTDDSELSAGPFSAWLRSIEAALVADAESDVPCGSCTACCTSSQFVHIEPDEVDTLAHIPSEVLFPAPRLPAGHLLMGYDERGHCPMLVDGACSIYEHRPRTCRTYDCRIFPAAGIEADADRPAIARQARRWRFEHPTAGDQADHEAVRAAARRVEAPANATEHAVLAIRSVIRRDEP